MSRTAFGNLPAVTCTQQAAYSIRQPAPAKRRARLSAASKPRLPAKRLPAPAPYEGSCRNARVTHHLKSQFLRAASSIALNLREGSAKRSPMERKRFYGIAFASLKECQAVLDLEADAVLIREADCLDAHLYRLWERAA